MRARRGIIITRIYLRILVDLCLRMLPQMPRFLIHTRRGTTLPAAIPGNGSREDEVVTDTGYLASMAAPQGLINTTPVIRNYGVQPN